MLFIAKPTPNRSDRDQNEELPEREIVPLRASAMIRYEEGFVVGVSLWVADGELFVATGEHLPLGCDVEVALAMPGHEETVRLEGEVSFLHVADEQCEFDRSGLGITIELDGA